MTRVLQNVFSQKTLKSNVLKRLNFSVYYSGGQMHIVYTNNHHLFLQRT